MYTCTFALGRANNLLSFASRMSFKFSKLIVNLLKILDAHLTPRSQPRKTRLMGISAEPQALLTLNDLITTKFQEYPKSEEYVFKL